MKNINPSSGSRRAFMGTMAAGVTAGLSLMSLPLQAKLGPEILDFSDFPGGSSELDADIKKQGKKQYPVAYDVSQANPWGVIWSNVYYMTNAETGIAENDLGVMHVLRHHGILYSFQDDLIKKYDLGKYLKGDDPKTGTTTKRNHLYDPGEGDLPMPQLVGLKALMGKGAMVCVCNMAYKVYSGIVAQANGLEPDVVYKEFVAAKYPGIRLAPSGVWVLGRLAKNGIAYIDSSVG
ncbi:hypothetical protein [Marinoscillum sp. MHG1-6]|uniref:hypothetical protein n=1 Tax=Marinoscillum sp. MHG1-6 TaxID=2959627 RepID=UPI0021584C41|nr:hypothetical protein [Marinoscillum sp. MHG1-6]